jgi:hypothetical protein
MLDPTSLAQSGSAPGALIFPDADDESQRSAGSQS